MGENEYNEGFFIGELIDLNIYMQGLENEPEYIYGYK